MNRTHVLSTALAVGSAWAGLSAPAAPERPNVILIFTDDQGS